MVARNARQQRKGNTLILLFGVPFALYLGLFIASPQYVKATVNPILMENATVFQEKLKSLFQKSNDWIRQLALQNQTALQQTELVIEEKIVPVVKSLSPTDVVKPTGEDAVFGENLPQHYENSNITTEMVLSDYGRRVPGTFDVPENLRKRVGFWLQIYTVYSSRYHIIHHVDYPWLVFKVVDTSPIVEGSGHKWVRYHRAEDFAEKAIASVRSDLQKMAKLKDFTRLTPSQQHYFDLLAQLPGKRSNVFAHAARHARIQLGQKDFFRMGLIRGSKYLPRMEEIFAQYDLPIELTRLPLVESSFNDKAVSKVGASGIWQFMPTIGKHYMKVSETIDERNSPLKATEGAARLMYENFRITRQWPFAVTAYNHGPGGVLRASKKLKTNDLATIIDRFDSDSFGFASSNFFTSFLAALHAERYQAEIFGDIPKYPPHETDEIKLGRALKASKLIDIVGITFEELKLYNKDLRASSLASLVLPSGYRLFLPPGRKARLELYTLKGQNVASNTGRRKTKTPSGPKRIKISFDEETTRKKSEQTL